MYLIAGDFNARHTLLGDRTINRHGSYLLEWNELYNSTFRTKIYPPDSPTYTPASSFLDICIADYRLALNETYVHPNKLPTLDYDSDHRAIIMSVDKILLTQVDKSESLHIPFKKINWRKFSKELVSIHTSNIPTNRNLSNTEIDKHVEILTKNINSTLAKFATKKSNATANTFTQSKRLWHLHKLKSNLLTEFFNHRKYDPYIQKTATKRIKNELRITKKLILGEIASIEEMKWTKLNNYIENSTPDKTLSIIKKMRKPRNGIKIGTLIIDKNNNKLINNVLHTINLNVNNEKNEQYFITDDTDKANILAAHYELINSPNNLNNNTRLRELIEKRIAAFNKHAVKHREEGKTLVNFSNETQSIAQRYTILNDYPHEIPFCDLDLLTKIIKGMPNKSSSGTDNIPFTVIKNLPQTIIQELVVIFNNAINNCYFPEAWKTAVIIPLLKSKKPPSDPASYRPISLTTSLSKLYEALINNALLAHSTKNKLISDYQFGFKRKHSTIHAINKLVSDVNDYLLDKQTVGAVLLDLEKAFDTVWLDGLIFTLISSQFPMELIILVTDMIRNKKFFVKYNNSYSIIRNITDGLQQGTINSPLLFSLYTNKILESYDLNTNNNTHAIAYADDVILYVADKQIEKIKTRLNDLVNKTNKLYTVWNLKLNPAKCETIVFRNPRDILGTPKAKEIRNFKISTTVPGTECIVDIPVKDTVKYLGLTMNYLMNFNLHIEKALNSAKIVYQNMNRLIYSKISSSKTRILCYTIFVRSLLTYACPIWWNTNSSIMEKLRQFERTCIRAALRLYKSKKSNYKHWISNRILYNSANLPRIDNFIIKLTRNYFNNIKKINNDVMRKLCSVDHQTPIMAASNGHIKPQDFMHHDQQGIIQDKRNVPIIYHWKRHRLYFKLPTPEEMYNKPNSRSFSEIIPSCDLSDKFRLTKKYWWLNDELECIKRLSTRFKDLEQDRCRTIPRRYIPSL